MSSSILTWDTVAPPGVCCCLGRQVYRRGDSMYSHYHDFAEVFWIEKGSMSHTANGRASVLGRGDLVMIRPSDTHQMRPMAGREFVLVNIAFRRDILRGLDASHFPGDATLWGGSSFFPERHKLSEAQIKALAVAVEELAGSGGSSFGIERFLLNLLQMLGRTPQATGTGFLPSWLAQACRSITEPKWCAKGTQGFAELCAKSPTYVARAVQRYLGRTPTDIVNDARMQCAARDLMLTDVPVSHVALDCGITSMPHFHHLFKAKFGMSPRKYRMKHRIA